ncbi:hypothetical protein [Hymenobacter jeollabukensis]|uniref:Uncharacterized protein n=1 Tax=Hymenobacter jeollabukensis TaxID=2025313 RepID=A0A5R8WSD3_9BACT|nr:hypothetical protein [Hymenobacter jeollabukensis]TLM94093.1 hypothetical protein FDY95_08695 [Hymenobacter jeollabukensis]
MSNAPESSRPLWWFLALPFGIFCLYNVLGGLLYALAVMGSHLTHEEGPQILSCASAAEARAAGVLLDTVLVTPRRIRYGAYTIEFTEGWLEELRETQRPAWYARPTVRPAGLVRLHIGYRVRRHDSAAPTADAPYLHYEQEYGGTPIDQETPIEVVAPRLRPDYYHLPLPVRFSLDDGPGGLPARALVACPARQCPPRAR